MGNKIVKASKIQVENGAKGAYIQYLPTIEDGLIRAISEVHTWRRENGIPYGSERIIFDENLWSKAKAEIDRKCLEVCGRHICNLERVPTESELKELWVGVRKGNYKPLRDNVPPGDKQQYPLWEQENPQGTIYVYSGSAVRRNKRFIKVGFTSGCLKDYLERLREEFDPKLLCHGPGGIQTERQYHCKIIPVQYRAFRKEWYFPDDGMITWIQSTFEVFVPQFDELIRELQSCHRERFADKRFGN